MEFTSPLTQAVLLKRYKRFLAEVVINNHEHRVIYCPNMGPMTGCDTMGSRVWFSHSPELQRRFPDTWELVEVDSGLLVCVNTLRAKEFVLEGITNGVITECQDYVPVTCPFPTFGEHAFDLILERKVDLSEATSSKSNKCFIQIHGVTLGDEIQRGFFPEAHTEKGLQQLNALIHVKELGYKAMLIFCVQHAGIKRVFPADHIDPIYGKALRQALLAGVEILAYGLTISLDKIELTHPVEVRIPARMICSSRS